METDFIQPLNYSAHAIEDLRKMAKKCPFPIASEVISNVCEVLKRSIKFVLPNCADFFEVGQLGQKHLDMARLPYSIVAFEAPWVKDAALLEINGQLQKVSQRRIALCWEPAALELLPGMNRWARSVSEEGVFILPIFHIDTGWTLPYGCLYQPYGSKVYIPSPDAVTGASREAWNTMINAGRATDTAFHYRAEPVAILPEVYEIQLREVGKDRADYQILMDCGDEAQMLLQACAILNCANVKTDSLPASKDLNRKRVARGKQPFFEYKVLQLKDEAGPSGGGSNGGSHSSPRMHLRRGHIRNLASGNSVWVRPAVVNKGSSRGVIEKDYSLETMVDTTDSNDD